MKVKKIAGNYSWDKRVVVDDVVVYIENYKACHAHALVEKSRRELSKEERKKYCEIALRAVF
jgi:hypothetical protein